VPDAGTDAGTLASTFCAIIDTIVIAIDLLQSICATAVPLGRRAGGRRSILRANPTMLKKSARNGSSMGPDCANRRQEQSASADRFSVTKAIVAWRGRGRYAAATPFAASMVGSLPAA
jgi:hypothetical protein